jgi:Fur family ferric uptake transcriptional regulator
MTLTLKEIYGRLLERGHKLTPQRWAIINIFLLNKGRHLSADEVYSLLRQMDPKYGIATVYRTLDVLVDAEVLKKLEFGDGRSRFELNDRRCHRHLHLVCVRCGQVSEFEDDLMDSIEAVVSQRAHFKVLDQVAKFYGLCTCCQGSADEERAIALPE